MKRTFLLLFLVVFSLFSLSAQHLSLDSVLGKPGSQVSMNLNLSGSSNPAGLQWTLVYPDDLTNVQITAGASSIAAAKGAFCASAGTGRYMCLLTGLNSNTIADGIAAVATFTIAQLPKSSALSVQVVEPVAASLGGDGMPITSSGGSIYLPPTLTSIICPQSLITPVFGVCTVNISSAVPNPTTVALASNSASLTLPATVDVPANTATVNFLITATAVTTTTTAIVTATLDTVSKTASVSLLPKPVLSSLICPVSLVTPNSGSCTVNISSAVPNPTTVALASNSTYLTLPATVDVPANAVTVNFLVNAAAVTTTTTAIVTATLDTVSKTASVSLLPPFRPFRINAGGTNYIDSLGQTWVADANYLNGFPTTTTLSISGTSDPILYQTDREALSTLWYAFTVPNGTYNVTLKFAEVTFNQVGKRVMNISVNGQLVLKNFDIVASAGGLGKAIDRTFTVNVTTGAVIIKLDSVISWPKVNAIAIVR